MLKYKPMIRRIALILLFFALGTASAFSEAPPEQKKININNLEPFKKDDRILIFAPHPDDETIGCAGIIQNALDVQAKVRVAYLTNGDHNELAFIVYEKRLVFRKGAFIHMGETRKKEAIKAMGSLGLKKDDLIFLGYPDFGTFAIFSQYWQSKMPFKDLLTRISSVPYKDDLSFGAPYNGENILADLKKVLLAYKPNKIFVSHPADVNVDHKALYLFLQVALADLKKEFREPKVYPYLIHCVGWPLPRHYHPELNLEPPAQFADTDIDWLNFELAPQQLEKKYKATLCYKSQTQTSAFYLLSFARRNELFSDYPRIKLSNQTSLKERVISYFGFSDMFAGYEFESLPNRYDVDRDKARVSYAIADDSFVLRLERTKGLRRNFNFILYLFGYSDKTAFARMPKIRIIAKNKKYKVLDNKKRIKPEGISVEIGSNTLVLKVPLKVLGGPDFILTSLRTYGGILPIDTSGFRRVDIK